MKNSCTVRYISLIMATSLLFAQNSVAQETLGLKQCIETGLKNNFDVRISKNNQRINDNNTTIGNAGFLPTVDVSGSYNSDVTDQKFFPSTGESALTNNNINNSGIDIGISLNWTIFDGFQMFTNYGKLKELQKAGELNTRLSIENFIATISSEYYNFIQQNIRYKNLKSAVKLSKERLRIVEARYNIGSMSKLDLQQAKVDFNADSSKLMKQQEILYSSRINLYQLMATGNVEQAFLPADSSITFNRLLSKDLLWKNTLQSNTLLLLAEKNKNISYLDLKSAQSKNYPYLKINAGYGYTSNKYEASSYLRQDYLGVNYGLTLGFNLFDGFNRKREQQNARIKIENSTLDFEQLQLSLQCDFANMWMAYQNNIELATLEQENLNNATLNYEIAIDRYKLGELSGIELREAQNSLLEAEERLVQAQYNTKLCEISLLHISGQISEYLK